MADGDYVIRRNATNTDVVPAAGSDLLLDWPTAVANQGSGITHSGGTFTLGETGHFLVMCSEHYASADNTNNERINAKMTLNLAGTELVEGYSTGYIRKNDTELLDWIHFSAAIINVTTTTGNGDDLQVRCERIDDVILTGPARVVDDRSGITILKLDDNWDYGRYRSASATATSATDNVRTVMNIQTQDEEDATFTRTGNLVDIGTSDLVLAVYSTKSEDAGAASRSEFQSNLELAGTAVPGSWNHQYIRNNQNTRWGGSSSVLLLDPTSGQDLEVGVISREFGGEEFEVALQLVRLPAAAEAIILESTAGNYNVAATNFSWPNAPVYEDAAAFTFSQPASNIDVDNAGDYLVMAGMGDTTDAGTAATRAMPAMQFRVNTTDIEHAGCTSFHRANGTADHSNLSCATLLDGLSANDSIHCRLDHFHTGVTTTVNNNSGQFAVIRLSSLFGGPAITNRTLTSTIAVTEADAELRLRDRETLDTPTVTDNLADQHMTSPRDVLDTMTVSDFVEELRKHEVEILNNVVHLTDNVIATYVPEAGGGPTINEVTRTDAFAITDNKFMLRQRIRELLDTHAVTDNLADQHMTSPRVIGDVIDITDLLADQHMTSPRVALDTLDVTDSLADQSMESRRVLSDALAATDSNIMLRIRLREALDTLDVTDNLADQHMTSRRGLLDTLAVTDTSTTLRERARGLLSEIEVIDSPVMLRLRFREFLDEIAVVDAVFATKARITIKQLLDNIAVTDSPVMLRLRFREFLDEIDATDASLIERLRSRLALDTLAVTDSLADQHMVSQRVIADNLAIADAAVMLRLRFRLLLDNIDVTDNVIAASTGVTSVTKTDTIAITDNITALREFNRLLLNAIALTDTPDVLRERYRLASDALAVVDFRTAISIRARSGISNLAVTDSSEVLRLRFRAFLETLAVTDNLADQHMESFRDFADSINVTDFLADQRMESFRDFADNIGVTDSSIVLRLRHRLLSDVIALIDNAIATYVPDESGDVTEVTRTDSIAVTDFVFTLRQRIRLVQDVLSATDSALPERERNRLLQDTVVGIVDSLSLYRGRYQVALDVIDLTDSATSRLERRRQLLDAIELTDNILLLRERYRLLTDNTDVIDEVIALYITEILNPILVAGLETLDIETDVKVL